MGQLSVHVLRSLAHLACPQVHHRQGPSSADAEEAVLLLVQCQVGHEVCVRLQGCYRVGLPRVPQLQQPVIIACKAEGAWLPVTTAPSAGS